MAIRKFTAADFVGKGATSMDDLMIGQTEIVKAKFDELVTEVTLEIFNALVDNLESTDHTTPGASFVKGLDIFNAPFTNALDVQALLLAAKTYMDNLTIQAGAGDMLKSVFATNGVTGKVDNANKLNGFLNNDNATGADGTTNNAIWSAYKILAVLSAITNGASGADKTGATAQYAGGPATVMGQLKDMGGIIANVTGKSTPIDADIFGYANSAASNALVKMTIAELKTAFGVSTGWTPVSELWTYSGPTSVTLAAGAGSRYKKGWKYKLTLASTNMTIATSGMTNGSANVTVASTAGAAIGAGISGPNIPANTTILSITDATHIVMSANATGNASSGTITVAASTRYGYIDAAPADTSLSLNGGLDYQIGNAVISNVYVSNVSAPLGFPSAFNYLPVLSFTGRAALSGFTSAKFALLDGGLCWYEFVASNKTVGGTATQPLKVGLPVIPDHTNACWGQNAMYISSYIQIRGGLGSYGSLEKSIELNKDISTGVWAANETGVYIFSTGTFQY